MNTDSKTNQEHEKLIEVLKFTPCTYKVSLWGYGGEYVMGTVDRKIYDYFKHRRLDLGEFAWDDSYMEENNIPEHMHPFYPGSWHECDNMGHCWGVDRSAGWIQINDENDNTVYESSLDDISGDDDEPSWSCGEEIWIDSQPAGQPVFIGVSSEKGTFFEANIELREPFNPALLCLYYDEIDGNEIVTQVEYDGETLENYGGDTNGKSSDFGFYIAGSNLYDGNGYEKYRNMEDINYKLTEWYPDTLLPIREGQYEVTTETGHQYKAVWTGKFWHNTWNEEKIKITQWRGIAYDPDMEIT